VYLPTQGFVAVTTLIFLLILGLAHHWGFKQMLRPTGALLERVSGRMQPEEPPPSPDEQPPP
jgi:hypothetical protein